MGSKRDIIGSSKRTLELKALIQSIAPSDGAVLITGESGCGKELYARAVHENSDRREGDFVAINCGAIPADLLESQLFGHKKGAFTGAVADYKGKFEEAEGGTLFLDEIGDMPQDMQVKLLRVLQEKNVTPIGSNRLVNVNVRIVAATHRDIENRIAGNQFRQDLFFRLNVLPVSVPPLRERPSEIRELALHFAEDFRQKDKKSVEIHESLFTLMEAYDWPGNVRELSNTIHRFSILYPGKTLSPQDIDPSMLPAGMIELMNSKNLNMSNEAMEPSQTVKAVSSIVEHVMAESNQQRDLDFESIVLLAQGFGNADEAAPSLKSVLSDLEKDLISKALAETEGNVSRSAKLLKMQRTTLIERIKRYDLQTF